MHTLDGELSLVLTAAFLISIAASAFGPRRAQGRWLLTAIALFAVYYLLFLLTFDID